ncbi:hypothetical protein PIROE2DRAFT_5807 [Piromyces sp. E2]|nr:hypothetical protein PIROE2DRAFT_5807 [Piromyces sp. E2]|eukprot:OUM66827.1 hypothetical protein PIROE2DRAFT_5807 [Piromyces sp. E2]
MITLTQVAALIQSIYHITISPLLLFYSEQLFNYPLFLTILRQNSNEFKATKSDTEFISILASVQIMVHSQISNILKSFKGVSYILSITRIEFILGIITSVFVVVDFIMNYDKAKEEEKKKFNEKVEKLKKEYGIKDDVKKEKEETKSDIKNQEKDKKNNYNNNNNNNSK